MKVSAMKQSIVVVPLLTLVGCIAPASEMHDSEQQPAISPERPASARIALERVFEVVESARVSGNDLRFSSIRASERRGLVDVRLDLSIPAEDDLAASRCYGELRGLLAAEGWCASLNQASTYPLEDHSGIRVEGLRIQVTAPGGGAQLTAGDPLSSMPDREIATLVRSAAALHVDELSRLVIKGAPHSSSVLRGEECWRISRSEGAAASLESVLAFAASLEQTRPGAVITEIKLSPMSEAGAEAVARWDYQVSMTVQGTRG